MINFRLYTAPEGTALNELVRSESYKKVYDNNIDEKVSFNSLKFNVKKIIEEPNSALFIVKNMLLFNPKYEKYQCLVRQ